MQDDTHYKDRDSLVKMETVMDIEDELDISIPVDMVAGCETELELNDEIIRIYRRHYG